MVNISNENLKLNIQIQLKKKIDNITTEDLNKIEFITLEGDLNNSNNIYVNIDDLKQFPNLKSIYLKKYYITQEVYDYILKINGLQSIIFAKCMFENVYPVKSSITSMELNRCYVDDYMFLSSLTALDSLSILYPYNEKEVDLNNIRTLNKINKLILDGCMLTNFNALNYLKELDYLSLLNTNLPQDSYQVINSLDNLKIIYSPIIDKSKLTKQIEVKSDLIESTLEKQL